MPSLRYAELLCAAATHIGVWFVGPASAAPGNPDPVPAGKLGPQHALSSYGTAVGDGSDATAAFMEAMKSGDNPVVTIPPGTFSLRGCPKFLASSSVGLVGAGMGKTIIRLSSAGTTCTDAIFKWIGRPDVQIRDFTIDLNDATAAPGQVNAFMVFGGDRLLIDHVEVKGGVGPNWFLISADGGHSGRITNTMVSLAGCSRHPNQGISLGSNFSPLVEWTVQGNILNGSGFAMTPAGRVSVLDNEIRNWCYGGGITVAQSTTPTFAEIRRNVIRNSGRTPDVNATLPSGIEDWGPHSEVTDNRISDVAANCVFIGGQNSAISGNECVGWSTGGAGGGYAAYTLLYFSQTINANGSRLGRNTSIYDGSVNSKYGVADTKLIRGTYVSAGNYGAGVAPYKISGGTTVVDPESLTSVANLGACGSGNKGSILSVKDAANNRCGLKPTAGGTVRARVFCNGAAWIFDRPCRER